jgi:uncharacterized protein
MRHLLEDKKNCLIRALSAFDSLAVALSGGVDSAVLLVEAHRVLGKRVIAITARSPVHPDREVADAARLADGLGVEHVVFESTEIENPDFLANTPERCYICKKAVFGELIALAKRRGVKHLAHGANADDSSDYRPGFKAALELGVAAPLMDAGFTKQDIRHLAKERDLFVWDKPSMACIATRFPYGTPISLAKVEQIKQAEQVLALAGIKGCRVRHHGDVARIEVPLDQLPTLIADPLRQRIVKQLRMIGFPHVSADLEGYISGSLNRVLDNDPDHGSATGAAGTLRDRQ